ncbi:MAG TPA: universal stress protein [Actinocatenispora sp.]
MTGPVLVGWDGSAASRRAVRWAAEAATLRHRPLRMLTVFRWPLESNTVEPRAELPDVPATRDQVRGMLAEEARAVRAGHPELAVEEEFVDGAPARMLVEQGRQAALTVLGQRGHGGLSGLLLGSASRSLLHRATCPVAVVRR